VIQSTVHEGRNGVLNQTFSREFVSSCNFIHTTWAFIRPEHFRTALFLDMILETLVAYIIYKRIDRYASYRKELLSIAWYTTTCNITFNSCNMF